MRCVYINGGEVNSTQIRRLIRNHVNANHQRTPASDGPGHGKIELGPPSFAKLLARKKLLIAGASAIAVVAIVGYYFFGNQTAKATYMTAKVEEGTCATRLQRQGHFRR